MGGNQVPKALTQLGLLPFGGLGSVRFMVRLTGLEGLFQPNRFCDLRVFVLGATSPAKQGCRVALSL